MFEFGTFLFSFVPILILIVFVVGLVVLIRRSKERSRQLDDISQT